MKVVFNHKGMSLIELLVALSLLVIVIPLLAAIFKEGLLSYDRTVYEADLQLSVRHQSNFMINEIRLSKVTEVNGVSYPICDTETLTLFMGTQESPETITYFRNGAEILRQVNTGPTEVIFKDVTYFQVTQEERLIRIKIHLDPETTYYKKPISKEIVFQARPRYDMPTF